MSSRLAVAHEAGSSGGCRLRGLVQRVQSRGLQRDRHTPIQLHQPAMAHTVFAPPRLLATVWGFLRRYVPDHASNGSRSPPAHAL